MGDVNESIRFELNAVLNGMPIFQQFGALLEKIKSHSNQKIQVGDSASIANTNQLATSIDKLAKAVDQLDEGKIGKVRTGLQSVALVINTISNIPGAFEGLKTLKNLATEIPGVASKIAGAGTAIHSFFTLARDKLGDAATAVKTKVTGMLEDIPKLIPGLAGAAGGLATIGITAAGAAVALGIVAAAIAAIVAVVVAIPAAASFLFNLANGAAEAGSKFHDLSQQTGVSVEMLSTLAPVADDSNSSIEQLAGGIGKFNKLIGQAASGSKEAKEDLKQFGIEPMEAIKNQDAALEKVFKRIIALPTGAEKAIAAQKAFGKSGAELIPTIIATGGNIDELKKKAQQLGVYWTTEGAAAADEFGDKLSEIKRIVTGLGLAVGQSLLPELLKLARVFAYELPQAGGAFGAILKFIGWNVRVVTTDIIGLIAAAKTLKDVPAAVAAGVATGSVSTGTDVLSSAFKANFDALMKVANTATPDAGPGANGLDFSGGGKGKKEKPPKPEDTSQSQLAVDRAVAEARFKQVSEALERENQLIGEKYKERKVTIADYYAEVLRIEDEKLEAEQIKLLKELNAQQVQLANAYAKIDEDRASGAIKSDEDAEAKKTNELNKAQEHSVQLNAEINSLRQKRRQLSHDVEQKEKADTDALNESLQRQIDAMDSLRGLGPLVQARQQIAEIDKLIEQFADNPGMVALLEEWREVVGAIGQADAAMSRFEENQRAIEAQIGRLQEQGNKNILARFIAEQRIRELRRQELKELENVLKLQQEIARTASGPAVKKAQEDVENTKRKIAELNNQTKSFRETLKDTFIDSVGEGLTNLFNSIGALIVGTKSLGDAFREMALGVVQALQQIITQMLVMLILKKLLGAFAGDSGSTMADSPLGIILPGLPGGTNAAAGDFFTARAGGRIVRVAEGGHDEVVLTTDPKHRNRTRNILSAFLNRTGLLEGFDLGGWISAITHPQFDVPALAAGDWISANGGAQLAGATLNMGGVHFHGVNDYKSFKQNQTAIERDLARATLRGVDRFRKG